MCILPQIYLRTWTEHIKININNPTHTFSKKCTDHFYSLNKQKQPSTKPIQTTKPQSQLHHPSLRLMPPFLFLKTSYHRNSSHGVRTQASKLQSMWKNGVSLTLLSGRRAIFLLLELNVLPSSSSLDV